MSGKGPGASREDVVGAGRAVGHGQQTDRGLTVLPSCPQSHLGKLAKVSPEQ